MTEAERQAEIERRKTIWRLALEDCEARHESYLAGMLRMVEEHLDAELTMKGKI